MKTPLFPERKASTPLEADYLTHGYCVLPGLAPSDLIDALLTRYREDVLPSTLPILRANGRAEINHLVNGHATHSIFNVHDETQTPGLEDFYRAACALAICQPILDAAHLLAGYRMKLIQSQMFDLAPTPEACAHQDSIYIDSAPPGHLIGIWIALEDIHPDAGPLYLVSWQDTPEIPAFDPEDVFETKRYRTEMNSLVIRLGDKVRTPRLMKGDVLMWNSRVIHGGHPPRDPNHSRMSLVCHWVPEEMESGTAFGRVFKTPYAKQDGVTIRRGRMNPRMDGETPVA